MPALLNEHTVLLIRLLLVSPLKNHIKTVLIGLEWGGGGEKSLVHQYIKSSLLLLAISEQLLNVSTKEQPIGKHYTLYGTGVGKL